jgi:glycosyltransferase involved in cell wall biosynthesis
MRLLFVVQRYGREVAGGAEAHCAEFARRLSDRGHDVHVLTTTALSYAGWENHYIEGDEVIDGVDVHRLRVAAPRVDERFAPLIARVVWGRKPVPLYLQREYMKAQGPLVPQIEGWLQERAREFDVVIFITYLYYTAWLGIPVAARLGPVVLHPTAHDEPPFYLQIHDLTFGLPSAFAFSNTVEAELIRKRFRPSAPGSIIGVGVDEEVALDPLPFEERFGLTNRPYLLYVGRVDPYKGSDELFDFFTLYKRRRPGPLALVIVGELVKPLPEHPDIVVTGFVDDETKRRALSGCLLLVHPSYFESFGLVLSEAWMHGKAVLVQRYSRVMAERATESGGGLSYGGFEEFEAAMDILIQEPETRDSLGQSGRAFVLERLTWDNVLSRYEGLLESTRN